MRMSEIMDIATSGLAAQRTRMTVTASNIANAQTTRTDEGGPYRRRDPVFSAERTYSASSTTSRTCTSSAADTFTFRNVDSTTFPLTA